jgi:SAM-dependent methyltransferase
MTIATGSPVSHRPGAAPLPSAWFARWMVSLGSSARVLDLACGSGRNIGLALERGARVLGIDRDPAALARLPDAVEAVQGDLEAGAWPAQLDTDAAFDAVLVGNYLFRPRLDFLPPLLAPGGLLLYETFGEGNARHGRPANPDFLLRPGELLALAQRHGLLVLGYEHGFVAGPGPGGAIVQRIAAARPPFEVERLPLAIRALGPGAVG